MANHFPPGFRFHPTDEELVAYYLRRKVNGRPSEFNIISDVDLYKQEPWDLPEKSHFVSNDSEWYFFSPRDKKYPNGHRTNRATVAGYWKATGKDRPVKKLGKVVGMKKTLVFYQGRAPHGTRTDWVMHEYRLEDEEKIQQDLYVLCRVFKKSGVGPRNAEDRAPTYEDEDDLTETSAPSTRGFSVPDTAEKTTTTPGSTARAEVPPSGGVGPGEASAPAEEPSVIEYTQEDFAAFNGSTPLEILDSEDFGTKFWDALGPAMTDDLLMWNPELGGSLDGFAIEPDDMLPPLVEERETDLAIPASTWNSSVDESGVPVETWGAPLHLQGRTGVSTDGLPGSVNTAAIASSEDLYTFHDSLFDFAGDDFPEDEESYLPALEEEEEYVPTIDFESGNFDSNYGLQDSSRFDISASGSGDSDKVPQTSEKLPTLSASSSGTSAPTKPLVAGLLKVLGSFPVLPASAAAFTEFPSDTSQLQLGATRPSYGSIQVSAVTVTCTYPADGSQQVQTAVTDGYEQVVGGAKVAGGKQKFVNCDTTVVGTRVQKRVVHGSNMGFLFVFGLGAFSALGWYWALRLMWRLASKAISSVF